MTPIGLFIADDIEYYYFDIKDIDENSETAEVLVPFVYHFIWIRISTKQIVC